MRRTIASLLLLVLTSLLPAAGGREPASPESGGAPDRTGVVSGGISPVRGFSTDFSRSTVSDDQIISGGPPKDGIPAIDDPVFEPLESIDWIGDEEAVLVVSADGDTHIYPLQILTYHEIVNTVVGSTPLAVTFCPLCNTGIVFSRAFGDTVLDFGTTGRLRYSNLLMYDRQTETWWQQATGEGVVGRYAGAKLEFYPVLMLPWNVASDRFPEASVLSRETGHTRAYGTNPYAGYDTAERPFLYRGPAVDTQYNPMTRVVQVVVDDDTLSVAYPVLAEESLVQRTLAGVPVVVFWGAGTASALDTRAIGEGRDVGSANAFRAEFEGRRLTFTAEGDRFVDEETGSTWDASGRATDGPLTGAELEPLVGIQHFWFSYRAFAGE